MTKWAVFFFSNAVLLVGLCGAASGAHAKPSTPLAKAYSFLYTEMDKYQKGATLRLIQSYVPTSTFDSGDISYTYDDTVTVIALLQRRRANDISRAKVLGDSLVYVQTHDPLTDGRVRAGYHAKKLIGADGSPNIAGASSDTGNLAWTGMAFVQLYNVTGQATYLTAAEAVANFIQVNAYDTRGAGGYTGGIKADQTKITYKSTEHNIDLYALFSMLAQITGDHSWADDAQHALVFMKAMWNRNDGNFYIGTGNDGVTINKSDPTPEDVQTWSYLSTGMAKYQGSIDWAVNNLSATSGAFEGLSFEVKDRSGVWFEGTGHAAAALAARNLSGDAKTAAKFISDIEIGQTDAPNANGKGIDAASKDGLETGDGGDAYFASLHIGATAWYCLAKQSGNPFRLIAQKD